MRLDLKDIIHVPGASKDFQFQLDLSQLEFYGSHPISRPVEAAGTVTNHAGALELTGTARSLLDLACDRCGKEFSREKAVPLDWPMSWRTRRTTRSCSWRAARWIWTSW